jgi:hypothetical protein
MLKVSHYISMNVSTSQDLRHQSPQVRDLEVYAERLFSTECSNEASCGKGQRCVMSNPFGRGKKEDLVKAKSITFQLMHW